jgi:2-keto-4-pentenoate hydratase/2-oxohepta-3-ene-1,7-dioic acid hydratase in catechol pathway
MRWIRYRDPQGQPIQARVDGDRAQPVLGSLFGTWQDHGDPVALDGLDWLPPVQPSKVIALWKNFHALAAKQQQTIPEEPLWALRAPSSLAAHRQPVLKPAHYDGAVFYEGELALVVGRTMRAVPPEAVLGPWIDTTFDWTGASVHTRVNGRERQNYPLSDMIFEPLTLLSRLSHDMTLEPGDVVLCGTSVGSLPMRPGSELEVEIDGLGVLANRYG